MEDLLPSTKKNHRFDMGICCLQAEKKLKFFIFSIKFNKKCYFTRHKGSQPSWDPLGALLGPFWSEFGDLWGASWESFWGSFLAVLGIFKRKGFKSSKLNCLDAFRMPQGPPKEPPKPPILESFFGFMIMMKTTTRCLMKFE